MKNNQNGFGLVGIFVVIAVISVAGYAGWRVWQIDSKIDTRDKTTVPVQNNTTVEVDETEESKPSTYTFEHLGIDMDILAGWEVNEKSTDEYYHWDIEKNTDSINIYISGLNRGWEGCYDINDKYFTPDTAMVADVAPTGHEELTFLRWGYGEYDFIDIVRADDEYFTNSEYSDDAYVKNKDLVPGEYNYCSSEPSPGLSLGLYENPTPDNHKYDRIRADIESNDPNTYTDIKTMMTSIRPSVSD